MFTIFARRSVKSPNWPLIGKDSFTLNVKNSCLRSSKKSSSLKLFASRLKNMSCRFLCREDAKLIITSVGRWSEICG